MGLTERASESRVAAPEEDESVELRSAVGALAAAVVQASRIAEVQAQTKVREILDRARRDVYAILAESE